jgi:hypothetical protein
MINKIKRLPVPPPNRIVVDGNVGPIPVVIFFLLLAGLLYLIFC